MKSTEILAHEHVLVGRLLRCLGALVGEAQVLGSLDRKAARSILRLFERFVDWSHQDKEELHLFPHMLARSTSAEAERLAHCFEDHAKDRRRFVGMCLHLEAACKGSELGLDRFVANALLFLRLQHKHVREEELFVLPLADAILTPEDDLRIQRGFREIDRRLGHPKRVQQEVAALCRRFRIDEVEESLEFERELLLVV